MKQKRIPVGCVPPAFCPTPLEVDHPVGSTPWMQTPPPRGRPPSPVNRMANASKNITWPQTPFVGGNYIMFIGDHTRSLQKTLVQLINNVSLTCALR